MAMVRIDMAYWRSWTTSSASVGPGIMIPIAKYKTNEKQSEMTRREIGGCLIVAPVVYFSNTKAADPNLKQSETINVNGH